MDESRRRQAENELYFRSLNETIARVGEEVLEGSEAEGLRVYDFVCECHHRGCTNRVPLTIAEYERIRGESAQFVVSPSPEHVDGSVEAVVDRSTRYWIVQKLGESAAFAEAEDPRHRRAAEGPL
jgi:hypothetical protein